MTPALNLMGAMAIVLMAGLLIHVLENLKPRR